jgi:hypothetical protein
LSSERWAFGAAGLLTLVGLYLLRTNVRRHVDQIESAVTP